MMKRTLLSACLLSLCMSPVWAADSFKIQDIRIEGLERTEPATVFSYLPVKIGDTFTPTKGEQIIKNLYATGFFHDVQVEVQGQQVLLTVTERPVISSLTVEGGKTLSNDDIRKNLKRIGLAQAYVYDPALLAQAKSSLQYEYASRGKNEVDIQTKITPLERNRVAVDVTIDEGKTTVIRQIDFSGNQVYSSRTLRNQMDLSEKDWTTWLTHSDRFSQEKFANDLDNLSQFYKNRGYLMFRVLNTEVVPNDDHPNDLSLKINVLEGSRFRWGHINFDGDTREVPMDELRALAPVKPGKWFKQSDLNDWIDKIKFRMASSGYANAEVKALPQLRDDAVDFTLAIIPNQKVYVNEIHIYGNSKTRDEIIRRELRQMESAPYDESKIERSRDRIQRLGYISDVSVERKPVANTPDQTDLEIHVTEQPTGSLDVSVGYVQDDGIVLSGGVSQDNLFGTGKSASFRVSNGSSSQVASLSFTDPYFTPEGVSLGYDIFWRTYDPNNTDTSAYKLRTYGLGARLGVPITEYDRINFGLGVNNMKITLYPHSPMRYRDFVHRYGEENWTITGNIGWGRNTTDSALWPTRGYIMDVNLESGLPGGDLQYYKATHNQSWFFPMTDNLTLMLSGGLGYADGYGKTQELPFFYNFYGGGLGSVRGYENGSVGPKMYDTNNSSIDHLGGSYQARAGAELLMPMLGMKKNRSVRLSVFADAGSVWDNNYYSMADYKYYDNNYRSTFQNELRYSAGAAITWISPLGPLKFSYAVPLNDKPGDQIQRFQFQLGTVF